MAVRTQCPRCKQPLSVPNKLAGSYASCPRCQGRFWVSKDAPLDPSVSDSVGIAVGKYADVDAKRPLATPPVAAPIRPGDRRLRPLPGPPTSRRRPRRRRRAAAGSAAAVLSLGNALAPPAAPSCPPRCRRSMARRPRRPPPPPQARKVARLVSAEAAQSTLKLAADGQLPHLQLQEGDKKDKGQGKSRSIPPAGHDRGVDLVGGAHGCHRDRLPATMAVRAPPRRKREKAMADIERAVLRQSRAGRTASLSAAAPRGPPGPCPQRLQGRTAILQAGPRSVAHGDVGRVRGGARAIAWRKALPAAATTTGNWNS